MARGARVRNFQRGGGCWGDESKSVGPDIDIRDGLLDLWHVAANTLIAGGACSMMSVRLDGGRARAVGRVRPMTFEAQNVRGLQEIRIVLCAMNIVAAKASHAMGVHLAGHEIVSLHSIFVSRAVREMSK